MSRVPHATSLTWRLRLKAWRKRFYEHLPYIKRKTYRRLQREFQTVRDTLLRMPDLLATNARWHEVRAATDHHRDEACLFVSYAPSSTLKPHVTDYINALLDEGIAVTFIVNTDIDPRSMQIPAQLLQRLNGCFIRQNIGFDFAAWAHAFSLLKPESFCRRLYLINDSIVGPLDRDAFKRIIERVRASTADAVGLTENRKPQLHLQSFFLAFNERLLQAPCFINFMHGVLNLPDKEVVIKCYETQLTPFLQEAGFCCEALFPNLSGAVGFDDETTRNWKVLVTRGFPFVKASVLTRYRGDPDIARLVPSKYLPSA